MNHKTGYLLCMAVLVLFTVSVILLSMILLEHRNSSLLQEHIADLKKENAELRGQMEAAETSAVLAK